MEEVALCFYLKWVEHIIFNEISLIVSHPFMKLKSVENSEIRKKIVAGRKRIKEESKHKRIEKPKEPLGAVDRFLIWGIPIFATLVLLSEKKCDYIVMGAIWLMDIFVITFLYTSGTIERLSYVFTNVALMMSGENLRNLHLLPQLLTPEQWGVVLPANMGALFCIWFLWIRRTSDPVDQSRKWDVTLLTMLSANGAAYAYKNGITLYEIVHRASILLRLVGI